MKIIRYICTDFIFRVIDISREILQFLHYHPLSSRDEIANGTAFEGSDATLKRLIAAGVQDGDIVVEGKARATRYRLSDLPHRGYPPIADEGTFC